MICRGILHIVITPKYVRQITFFLYRFGWGDMLATSRNATKMVLDPLVDHFEPWNWA